MTGAVLPVSRTLIENVDNRFMYFHHTNSRLGTNALTIAAQFKEANLVVLVNCLFAKDELFPLGDGLQRPHGTVYQAVTPDITLAYNRAFQYTPLSTNGVRHRTTFIEEIRSAAEAAYVETTRITIRHVTAGMETTSTFVEPSSEYSCNHACKGSCPANWQRSLHAPTVQLGAQDKLTPASSFPELENRPERPLEVVLWNVHLSRVHCVITCVMNLVGPSMKFNALWMMPVLISRYMYKLQELL
ncbi:hypothetical protein Ae201684P_001254 [Aphanomyces euteiches]|nr:hypothetical protein Ae201684P_001254 [Aphanomyces euteiches]